MRFKPKIYETYHKKGLMFLEKVLWKKNAKCILFDNYLQSNHLDRVENTIILIKTFREKIETTALKADHVIKKYIENQPHS